MMTIISTSRRIAYKIKRIIFKNNRLGRKKNPFPSDQELFTALRYKGTQESFLSDFKERKDNIFFINTAHRKEVTDLVKENFPETITKTIRQADTVCLHIFDLLGSGPTDLSTVTSKAPYRSIRWHQDFKSKYEWDPETFYFDIKYGHLEGVDVKVPWELSRFQHLITLGKAYWYVNYQAEVKNEKLEIQNEVTGKEKYSKEFVNQINDWIDHNPPGWGVNWVCTMDVAIRTVNWIWGFYFLKNSPVLTNDFLIKFYKSLLSHGRHIMNNLEYGPLNSNHYLSDLVGLVYLGILFPEFKEAKKWRNFGIKELIKEMKKQVHSDGVDYEASTSYHRLVTELFLSATLLCQKNGIEFPSWYLKRLEKMIEYIIYYTTPNGSAPVLGDNDNGRLQKLETQEINDHKSLCSTGAVLFNRADFKNTAGKFYEESFWLLGETGLNKFNTLKAPTDNLSSKPFSSGGSYIMRKNNLYMIIDGGDSGMKGTGGHGHNDLLSFELYAYDKTFIVDPGSYVYTPYPEERFYFKSTQAHNTVVVDDKEIARFNGFWGLKNDAQPKIHKWKNTEQYDFFDAEHSGYQRLTPPVIHRRQVYFNKIKSYWVIKDILNGKGKHKLNLYFHLTPLKSIRNPKNKLMVYTQADQGANLAIIPLETENLTLEIMEGWISPGYGVKTKAPVIKYIKETTLPAQFITILAPYREQYFSMDLLINIKEEINEFYGSIL